MGSGRVELMGSLNFSQVMSRSVAQECKHAYMLESADSQGSFIRNLFINKLSSSFSLETSSYSSMIIVLVAYSEHVICMN